MTRLFASMMALTTGCVVLDPRLVLDPVVFATRTERRGLECEHLTLAQGHERFPGQIPAPRARTVADTDRMALVCSTWVFAPNERAARDEAILSTLSTQVSTLSDAASALVGPEVTWHIDAFYPNAPVAQKIAAAARTLLAQRGLNVSDGVPLLAAGDVAVLATLPQSEVYRTGCARAFATAALGPQDVFLGLMIVDAKETQLHGGVCQQGEWRWLQ
jgi:hypothetical protein